MPQPDSSAERLSYVICTSPRSGSTLLCRMLAATGAAGNPDSHFHHPSLETWLDSYGLSGQHFTGRRAALAAVFAAARKAGTTPNGVFGLRLQSRSLCFFLEQAAALYPEASSGQALFRAAFGPVRFIRLTRLDRLAQAVSLVRAGQSGLWHRNADGSELERLAPPQPPEYDAAAISECMAGLTAWEQNWDDWFGGEEGQPLRLTYEELSAAPAAALARLLAEIGLDPALVSGAAPPTAKLADEVSRNWIERFRAEHPHA